MLSNKKKEYLDKLGIDLANIPTYLQKELLSFSDENFIDKRFLESSSYTIPFISSFCIKDIVGTKHPDYQNKSLIEAFLELKRGDENISLLFSNPFYYSESLKNPDQSLKTAGHDTPLELYRMEDGRLYINGGNNRIILLLLAYYKEINNCRSEEERKKVNDKYTFYGEIKALPQNTEIKHIIAMLEDIYANIKIKFIGNNPDDCHYLITLDDQRYEINNINDLKTFLFSSYSISNLASKEILYSRLISLITNYIRSISLNDEIKIKLFKEICPNIDILREVILDLRRKSISSNVLDNIALEGIDYNNIVELLQLANKNETRK